MGICRGCARLHGWRGDAGDEPERADDIQPKGYATALFGGARGQRLQCATHPTAEKVHTFNGNHRAKFYRHPLLSAFHSDI